MTHHHLIPHLFRTEFGKIVVVLCKRFGMEHMELAEDITMETFLAALETWSYKGLPENPTAWLYTVAKNKATNHFMRQKVFTEKVATQVKAAAASPSGTEPDIDLSEHNITDSQLKMLFAICHPVLPVDAQIGLALRILCGFGTEEIANAFLSNKDTINKRLARAKEKLRHENIKIEFPPETEISQRLDAVLTTLYLLFSEGYYSESNDAVLRKDLCLEAMRLVKLLLDNELTNRPAVNALFALMCFHASRFEARQGNNGELLLYADQDESLWNTELIAQGALHMKLASQGNSLTRYHLEAGIAYWHTIKNDTAEKWENILQLYNRLLQLEYSPIAALNRTYALSKVHGRQTAIAEAEKLQLTGNPYYFTLLGSLYTGIDNHKAKACYRQALALAKTNFDRQTIQQKIDHIQ